MLAIEKTIGLMCHFVSVRSSAKILTGDMFELRIPTSLDNESSTGQYLMLNVPSVSVLEWHPMTITWSNEDELALHIKTRGDGTWTKKVFDEILSSNGSISIRLDGPYGTSPLVEEKLGGYDSLVFICGGCGLTFPVSLLPELCHNNERNAPISLFWVTRTLEEFRVFENMLSYLKNQCQNLTIVAWVTLSQVDSDDVDERGSCERATLPLGNNNDKEVPSSPPTTWKPMLPKLWPNWMHALIHAIVIPLATVGYAMACKNNGGETLSDEPRYLLVNRFVELLLSLLMVYGFTLTCLGVRWGWKKLNLSRSKFTPNRPFISRYNKTTINSFALAVATLALPVLVVATLAVAELVVSVLAVPALIVSTLAVSALAVALLAVPAMTVPTLAQSTPSTMTVIIGRRPDLPTLFRNIQRKHPNNVFVAACGPTVLIESVRQQYKGRISSGWVMADEAWEW